MNTSLNAINSILLIDDDNIANYLHASLIRKVNLTTTIFVKLNGREALNFLEESYAQCMALPSLIFCDLNMPVLNGFEFIEWLRQNSIAVLNNIPLVALSTSACDADMKKMNELKVQHCLAKPLTREKLLSVINNIFRKGTIHQ